MELAERVAIARLRRAHAYGVERGLLPAAGIADRSTPDRWAAAIMRIPAAEPLVQAAWKDGEWLRQRPTVEGWLLARAEYESRQAQLGRASMDADVWDARLLLSDTALDFARQVLVRYRRQLALGSDQTSRMRKPIGWTRFAAGAVLPTFYVPFVQFREAVAALPNLTMNSTESVEYRLAAQQWATMTWAVFRANHERVITGFGDRPTPVRVDKLLEWQAVCVLPQFSADEHIGAVMTLRRVTCLASELPRTDPTLGSAEHCMNCGPAHRSTDKVIAAGLAARLAQYGLQLCSHNGPLR